MFGLRSVVAALGMLALVACSAAGEAEISDAEGELGSCRALSPLGEAVALAAKGGRSTTPLVHTERNRVLGEPIVGGEAYAKAMVDLVRSAKREVIFEVFILDDGWLASRLHDAIQALDPDIPVYVLVSTDRSRDNPVFREDNPPSFEESTARRVLQILDPGRQRNVIVASWTLSGFLGIGINHDKAIVVDRQRAIVSNINLEFPSDPSARNPEKGQTWYQMGVAVEGDIARSVAEEVKTAWTHAGYTIGSRGEDVLPRDRKTGKTALPDLPDVRTPNAAAAACVPMISLGREVKAKDESSANAGFLTLFKGAQRNLNVITPNLNAKSALAALADATKTSNVSVVVSKGFTETLESLPGQGGGNEEVVTRKLPRIIAERGGDPCKMHVRYYARPERPGEAVVGEAEGQSHAKFASADGQVVVVGSQNMDTQSWEVSRELSVAIDDAPATAKFDAEFARVWQRSACAFECGGCR